MEFQYKKADISDIDTLTQMRIHVLRAANKLSASVDMSAVEQETYNYYKEALPSNEHIAYLVLDSKEVVGTGGVSFYKVMPTYHNVTGTKAYIMNMYTHPNYRRNGIAFKTLGLLVSEAKARGVSFISLEATDMGKPLYEKFGFISMRDEMLLPEQISL